MKHLFEMFIIYVEGSCAASYPWRPWYATIQKYHSSTIQEEIIDQGRLIKSGCQNLYNFTNFFISSKQSIWTQKS